MAFNNSSKKIWAFSSPVQSLEDIRKGNSLQCNKHIIHCKGLWSKGSNDAMQPRVGPVIVAVPSEPMILSSFIHVFFAFSGLVQFHYHSRYNNVS